LKIVLATGNKSKIKEFKNMMQNDDVVAYSDIIDEVDIVEDGDTFASNALIKAQAISKKLKLIINEPYVVISDDSGITVPVLNNQPGIKSARYAGAKATDKQNLDKLIDNLKNKNIIRTPAYYTASIAIIYNDNEYTVHGWMYGDVIDSKKGIGGFGYDPIFIPKNYNKTLGELNKEIKKNISHRSKALTLAKKIISVII
jgi:XTP/dITP diphosphohydrolase